MKYPDIPAPIRGALSLLSATILYGMFGILSRIVGYNLPLFYQNWTRVFVAAGLLVWTYRSWKPVASADWIWIVARMIASISAFLLFFIAVNAMPVSLTYFVFYGGSTMGGFILGATMFHERTTPLRIACLILAGLGLLLVYGVSTSLVSPLFAVVAFLSGICTSLWSTISKKVPAYPTTQMTFLDNALSLLVLIPVSLILKEPWPIAEVSIVQGTNLLLGALFAVTGLLMVYGFRKLDAQIGSLIMLSEVLFAVFFGFLFYQEIPSVGAVIGGILIITAMILPELNWKTMLTRAYANRRKTDR